MPILIKYKNRVKQQTTAETGDVVVVLVNEDESTVKKIRRHDEGISLIPFNSIYETKFYMNKEIEELPVEVIGKVAELRGEF